MTETRISKLKFEQDLSKILGDHAICKVHSEAGGDLLEFWMPSKCPGTDSLPLNALTRSSGVCTQHQIIDVLMLNYGAHKGFPIATLEGFDIAPALRAPRPSLNKLGLNKVPQPQTTQSDNIWHPHSKHLETLCQAVSVIFGGGQWWPHITGVWIVCFWMFLVWAPAIGFTWFHLPRLRSI